MTPALLQAAAASMLPLVCSNAFACSCMSEDEFGWHLIQMLLEMHQIVEKT